MFLKALDAPSREKLIVNESWENDEQSIVSIEKERR
jgi:hypothetical protein